MSATPAAEKPPLDEIMLAMDVVDTLRHRQRIVERALSAEDRDRELIDRLREIYAGQGIEVSESVLERGVADLRANRFVYTPTPPSFRRTLAHLYVSRGRWGKPLLVFVGLVAAALLGYQMLVRGPALDAIAALPAQIADSYSAVVDLAEAPGVDAEAAALRDEAELAYAREDYDGARAAIAGLEALRTSLASAYQIRVRSEPGELSGVWRVPDANPNAQSFYLIVEAIDADGNRLTVPITNEETGRVVNARVWGQRVDEETFRAVARDKQDDGIIQDALIGEKRRGLVAAEFEPGVRDGAITDW